MELQTLARNLAGTTRVVLNDLSDYARKKMAHGRTKYDERVHGIVRDLERDGYAVIRGYWSRERALSTKERLETYLEEYGKDVDLSSGAYIRFWDNRSYDQGVRRIYHVDKELPELREFRFDPLVFQAALAYYGIPFYTGMAIFQHNTRTNENTREYHVDAFAKEFKSFLYLDDVDEGNGPFTFIRGSHRSHLLRLRKQVLGNKKGKSTSFYEEELKELLQDEVQIAGPAGTLILADVRGFHRGSPQKNRSRSVLMNYLFSEPGEITLDK